MSVSLEEYFSDGQYVLEEPIPIPPPRLVRNPEVIRLVKSWNNNYGFTQAACRGVNTTPKDGQAWVDFHPEVGHENPAKLICQTCVHKVDCMATAVVNRENKGIWGGTTPEERRKIFKNYRHYKKRHNKHNEGTALLTLEQFTRLNGSKYVDPPDELGQFDSGRPELTRVMADAFCLTTERETFEDLDSRPVHAITALDFAQAVAICRKCPNFERGCDDLGLQDTDLQPTIAGGKVVGDFPLTLLPSERLIRSLE